ncbi:MAG TPA: hypothetical protein VGB85_09965 [Nannocystis sp.]|jgi:hypothetical protein
MKAETGEVGATAEPRAARLLQAGIGCLALLGALLFLPRLLEAVGADRAASVAGGLVMHGVRFAAIAASALGFWAGAVAPLRSPVRGTGRVLGLVGLALALLLGFFLRGGP